LRDVAKNVAVKIALEDAPEDSVILAAGDDRTDEDMFGALPPNAFSIRVGSGATAAKLRVESPRTLLGLLARLV
jgi:trehalose 6-phosphate synthase/phosphatase